MSIETAIIVSKNPDLTDNLSTILNEMGFVMIKSTSQVDQLEFLCCPDGVDTTIITEINELLNNNNKSFFTNLLLKRNAQIVVVLNKDQTSIISNPDITRLLDGFVFQPVDQASLQATILMAKLRHNRELDLTVSEDKFHRLFHNSPEPSFLIIDGVFVDCNQAALKVLKAKKEQIVGLTPAQLSPPRQPDGRDSQEKASELIQHALTSGHHLFEWVHTRLEDGAQFIAEVVLITIPLNEKLAVFVKWRDVSEIETFKKSLLVSQEQYKQLFETMLNGFALHEMIYDGAGNPTNYRFLAVNPAFERLTSLKADQIIGKTVLEVLPHTEPVWIETYGQVAKTGEPKLVENYSSALDRYYRVYAFSPQPGQFATLVEDITPQKQNEKFQSALIELSEILRQVYSSDDLVQVAVKAVSRLLEIEDATIAVRLPHYNDRFKFIAGIGVGALWVGKEMTPDSGMSGYVLRTRRPYFHKNIHEEPYHLTDQEQNYTQYIAALPLITDKEILGALVLGKNKPFSETDQRIMTAMGELISNAMHRIQLQEKTNQTINYLSALRKIDMTITSGENLEKRLDAILTAVVDHQKVDAASIWLKQTTDSLVLSAFQGFQSLLPVGYTSPSPGLKLDIYQINHFQDDDLNQRLTEPFVPAISLEGFTQFLSIPLVTQKSYWGILQLWKRSEIIPTEEWISLLEMLAGQAAIAIEDLQLLTDLQHHIEELRIAYDSTLEGWAKALEIRDAETQDHSRRVTSIVVRLARLMGIPEEDIPHIRRGTMLHDIGKMGIPDAILNKQGPLTPQEWQIMHRHPQMAYDVLSGISFLRPALDIPYCHHEKWDGSGYPRGLRGEEIPLSARIFAVVDVWDALLSDRPYRHAWSVPDTIAYIREQSGKHFDPRVVDIFLNFIQNTERDGLIAR